MIDITNELATNWIADICRHNHVQELSVFGSVLTEKFTPTSDLDLLVVFKPDVEVGFLALARLQRELSEVVHHPVDLVPKAGLKPAIRDAVIASAKVIYAA